MPERISKEGLFCWYDVRLWAVSYTHLRYPGLPVCHGTKGMGSLIPLPVSYTHLDVYKRQVKWDIVVEGKQEKQKEQGEVLHLQIKEAWVGKEITVMPYLKQATTKTSVKTEVSVSYTHLFSLQSSIAFSSSCQGLLLECC